MAPSFFSLFYRFYTADKYFQQEPVDQIDNCSYGEYQRIIILLPEGSFL